MTNTLKALLRLIHKAEVTLAVSSLLLLLFIAFLQILARNLFDYGLSEADVVSRHLVLYVIFFGAVLAIRNNSHIRIDILAHLIPDKHRALTQRIMSAFAAGTCAFLSYAAIHYWRTEWSFVADYERWVLLITLILPTGFILMTLHYVIQTCVTDPIENS